MKGALVSVYLKDSESRPSGEAHPAMHLLAGLGPLPWANALSSARFPKSKPGKPKFPS